MKKIALALALISISIPSLTQAKEGEQTIGSFKINYPNKFNYAKEITKKFKDATDETVAKSVVGYSAEPTCKLASVVLNKTEYIKDLGVTSESMEAQANEAFNNFPSHIELLSHSTASPKLPGVEAFSTQMTVKVEGVYGFANIVQFYIPSKKEFYQLSFSGTPENEKEDKQMQSCVKSIVDSIGVVQ
ncbi:hypothetical protein AB6F61_20555 [Providencia hangzhouensis]|uniref:hypothetical protein n=1 Tax=Providencia hangzhouensis TaxID=3031799 RepID=UPI0034DCE0BE